VSFTGHRTEGFRVELLTSTEASLGDVEGVIGGELKWNGNARLPAGGSLDLVETDQEINFSADRIRVWWSTQQKGEEGAPIPWGTDQNEYTDWVEQERNLHTNPIPTSATGFGVANAATVVYNAATQSVLVTCSPGATDSGAWMTGGVAGPTSALTRTYSVEIEAVTAVTIRLSVQGTAGVQNAPGVAFAPGERKRLSLTVNHTGAGTAVFYALRSSGAGSEVFRVRKVRISDGTGSTYLDGNIAPYDDLRQYRWLGAVNTSASVYETRTKTVHPVEWPLGVYVMAAPSVQYGAETRSRKITLIDKLTVVADDCLTETLQIAAGANVIDAVIAQIQATGETRISATTSTKVLNNAMTWAPGESRLAVVNDLLAAAGYWSLWTDSYGQFRVEPYTNPADRPIVWTFEEGATAIHSPEWEYELALWDATNTVVLVSQENSAGDIWTATAVDDNPDSPTSTVSMGRVLNPIVEENVEATSLADLQAQANRKLLDNSNVAGKLSVAHAAVPVWYQDGVQFISQGVNTKATITQMSLRPEPGSLIRAEWSQV
jgi:hypothetical protein